MLEENSSNISLEVYQPVLQEWILEMLDVEIRFGFLMNIMLRCIITVLSYWYHLDNR